MAADRGVRVFTVGFGTQSGETIGFEGWSMRVRLDEETLKTIANKTRGEYFYAGTATDLKKVYQSLQFQVSIGKEADGNQRPVCGRGSDCSAGFGVAFAPVVSPHPIGEHELLLRKNSANTSAR